MNSNNKTIAGLTGLYVPSSFNAKERLIEAGFAKRYVNAQSDKYNYFLHLIHYLRIMNPKYKKRDFIRIDRTTLEKTVGIRYVDDILKYMIKVWEIVECDYKSTAGKSLGYRFTSKFLETFDKVIYVDIVNEKFEARISTFQERRLLELDEATQYIGYHLTNIGIHINQVKEYITNTINNEPFEDNGSTKTDLIIVHFEAVSRINKGRQINDNAYFINRDSLGKRVHHNLSHLKKSFRNFVYLKDNPKAKIYALDVANFQPYALCSLIQDYFKGSKIPPDVQLYFDLCHGKLYAYLKELWDMDEVEKAKKEYIEVILFGKNQYANGKFGKIFRLQFPSVYEVIAHYKAKDYKKLAYILQRLESKIMIDGVALQLSRKYKDKKWFSTIHDSILCTEDLVAEVKDMILANCTAEIGFPPKVKEPEWINEQCLSLTPQKALDEDHYPTFNLETLNTRLQQIDNYANNSKPDDGYTLDFSEDGLPIIKFNKSILRRKETSGVYCYMSAMEHYHDVMHLH